MYLPEECSHISYHYSAIVYLTSPRPTTGASVGASWLSKMISSHSLLHNVGWWVFISKNYWAPKCSSNFHITSVKSKHFSEFWLYIPYHISILFETCQKLFKNSVDKIQLLFLLVYIYLNFVENICTVLILMNKIVFVSQQTFHFFASKKFYLACTDNLRRNVNIK